MDGALSAYRETLDYLFARTTGTTRLGLERTRELLRLLGDPHQRVPSFHIAGTNGKGSVAATLDTLLRGRGLRAGKFTSPHLVDFRERLTVGGEPVAEEAIVDFVGQWLPDIERIGATFFEATTALAFHVFARLELDVAVIETGLGGRLDSTNVVSPVVAGVTSIGLDHRDLLGDTLQAIADEKAAIFKPGVPAIIGETGAHIAAHLAARAREHGAHPIHAVREEPAPAEVTVALDGTRFRVPSAAGRETLQTGLIGRHQVDNTRTALAMLRAAGPRFGVDAGTIARHLPTVRLAGRFQVVDRYIFDVAHNPDGARVLAATLAEVTPRAPIVAVLCVLADKDWRGIMDALAPAVSELLLTIAPTAPEARRWDLAAALAYARDHGWRARAEPDFDGAIAAADSIGATVLITGSFHTVGDAMLRLQVDPLRG